MSISNIAKLHDFKTIELFFICQNSTFYCHIKYKIKRCTEKRLCHYASFGTFSTSSWYCLSLFVELTQKTLLWYWVWEFDQTKNCLAWTIYTNTRWFILIINIKNSIRIPADDAGMQLGVYGNDKIRSPNTDALAQKGTIFTNAFTSVSSCSPR